MMHTIVRHLAIGLKVISIHGTFLQYKEIECHNDYNDTIGK